MIDTKLIRERCGEHPLDDKRLLNSLPCGIEDLCNHIDELERKLKIAEEGFDQLENSLGDYTIRKFASTILKQIRGE